MTLKKKNRRQNPANTLLDLSISEAEAFTPTHHLRYSKKLIPIDNSVGKYEYRLQQLWTGNFGSKEWRWVESVD